MAKKEAVEQEVVASRIVTLENGETVDFGVRNQVISGYDVATGEITFKVFTGEVISLNLSTIEALNYAGLSELARTATIAGYMSKIKSNLAPIKLQTVVEKKDEEGNIISSETVNTLAQSIVKQVAKLAEGTFDLRAGGDATVELDIAQKAFANATVKQPLFASALEVTAFATKWSDLSDVATIAEVSDVWASLGKDGRNKAKKHPYFQLEKALLEVAGLQG